MKTRLHQAREALDRAWDEGLAAYFGRRPGDRFDPVAWWARQKRHDAAWKEWEAAMKEWEAAMQKPACGR